MRNQNKIKVKVRRGDWHGIEQEMMSQRTAGVAVPQRAARSTQHAAPSIRQHAMQYDGDPPAPPTRRSRHGQAGCGSLCTRRRATSRSRRWTQKLGRPTWKVQQNKAEVDRLAPNGPSSNPRFVWKEGRGGGGKAGDVGAGQAHGDEGHPCLCIKCPLLSLQRASSCVFDFAGGWWNRCCLVRCAA